MWNKIYPIALAVFVLIMIVLAYLAFSELQSIGFKSNIIAENFQVKEGYYRQFLWLSSVLLLIVANVLLWLERRAWALWATLAYFAIFLLIDGWWLGKTFFDYQKENNLSDSLIPTSGLLTSFVCVIAAIGIFFNQFLVLRMRDRIHGVEKPVGETVVEGPPPTEET
jgi:hypothetical protein